MGQDAGCAGGLIWRSGISWPMAHSKVTKNRVVHPLRSFCKEVGAFLRSPSSIYGDLSLQQDVTRRVTYHDLVGAGDHAPAFADYVPVGK
jgi:hypothetical protein